MRMETQEMNKKSDTEAVPLGVLLSEEVVKSEIHMAVPTSAYWTGRPDEGSRDPDA